MVKKVLLGLLVVLLLLAAVLVFNTLQFKSKQLAIEAEPAPEISGVAVRHFQNAIHYRTISFGDSTRLDTAQFFGFHRFLKTTYPRVHANLKYERVGRYSLLYSWEGRNPSLAPIVMMAHQDVVPIEEETRKMWTVDPFEGVVKANTLLIMLN
jgi:carboxypeptidase PM20D1